MQVKSLFLSHNLIKTENEYKFVSYRVLLLRVLINVFKWWYAFIYSFSGTRKMFPGPCWVSRVSQNTRMLQLIIRFILIFSLLEKELWSKFFIRGYGTDGQVYGPETTGRSIDPFQDATFIKLLLFSRQFLFSACNTMEP